MNLIRHILNELDKVGIVSIIRGIDPGKLSRTVQALYDGGIRAVEVTFDTPGASAMIEAVRKEFHDKMVIGAGTVLDAETARAAILSGADFILSPSLDTRVIEMCCRYSKVAVPGVLTPTEVLTAWQAGAQLVKVFPARAFGPAYIKDIKAPLKQVEIMAVGGITIDNAAEYIRNGASSVGIGSELVNASVLAVEDFNSITKNATAFVSAVQGAKLKGVY